ncbi:MAG: ribonuclease P protein component 1 [Candidatus Woesearchaeota archaeon]
MEGKASRSYIGKTVTVLESSNDSYIGCAGTVVDETRFSFLIETSGSVRKRVLKKGSTFLIDGDVVDGDIIIKRPEERIKSRGK